MQCSWFVGNVWCNLGTTVSHVALDPRKNFGLSCLFDFDSINIIVNDKSVFKRPAISDQAQVPLKSIQSWRTIYFVWPTSRTLPIQSEGKEGTSVNLQETFLTCTSSYEPKKWKKFMKGA
jgi:hypothetical protein